MSTKDRYRDWQRRAFKEVTVEVSGRKVKYLLGERMLRLAKGFRVREVRRLCDDGHQSSVVTTRRDLPVETVALRMFSRWQQENFFRYMRHEFALDHLPATAVEPADPQRSVPNPAVKDKQRELGRVKAELTKAEQAYGQHAHENPQQKIRTVRGFKISHAELGRKIEELRCERERLEVELKAFAKKAQSVQQLSAKVSRLFHRLHVYGLIVKVPRSRRWRVTEKGLRVLSSAIRLRDELFPDLYATGYA